MHEKVDSILRVIYGASLLYDTRKKAIKHNRLTSGELLSNDRRAVGFVSS